MTRPCRLLTGVVAAAALAAAVTMGTGVLSGTHSAQAATTTGSPSDPNIKYYGHWDTSTSTAYVSTWAGAYLKVGFTGTTVKLKQRNTIDLYASIDGGAFVTYAGVSGTVNLTSTALTSGKHTLQVSYRPVAGSYTGDAVFQGITLDSGATTFAPTVGSKVVEFIGDSITVGQTNSRQALDAYGWVVSERLGYEHAQIAQGGACLVETSDGCVGMSQRYFNTSSLAGSTAWDFSRYTADAVVINLGTNDVGHSVSTTTFQSTYTTFLANIRAKYPNATIFAMENFKKRYATQTQAAVAARVAAGDSNVAYINTEGWIATTDTNDGTHPSVAGHVKIADQLEPILSAALD